MKMKTNRDLRRLIRAALDCPGHFIPPTIINNDDYLSFGKDAIVICQECVKRLREAIGLKPGDPVPSYSQFDAKINHPTTDPEEGKHGTGIVQGSSELGRSTQGNEGQRQSFDTFQLQRECDETVRNYDEGVRGS